MISIPAAVDQIIKESPFLEELLSLKIINLSGLAREIKSSVEERTYKQVTQASIMMSLKRRVEKLDSKRSFSQTVINKPPEIIVRSNLYEVTHKNSQNLIEQQAKIIEYADRQQNRFITFTRGMFETTTIASIQLKDMIDSLYKKEEKVFEIENIATISIRFSSDIVSLPFVYYSVLRTIAWAGISIVEVVSTYSELVIAVKEEDVELSFSVIKKLFSKDQKRKQLF